MTAGDLMPIVLDAMGSDDCPKPEIEASIYAAKNLKEKNQKKPE